ncbi:MAG: hypothetical protein JNM72_21870 [Deltaproteobacteria bacterium]|nr:hypothetical protein [Deltaproteobacteria bacterium]
MPEIDPTNPVDVYVNSIRSVLFVDDGFPTLGDSDSSAFGEPERARALWKGFTERGWLCDIENRVRSGGGEGEAVLDPIVRRIANADLLVLDYHLDGNDPKDALEIVARLARDPSPNLVVVYTAETNLTRVLLSMAFAARGRREWPTDTKHQHAEVDIFFEVPWTLKDMKDFLCGSDAWHATWSEALQAHLDEDSLPEDSLSLGALTLENHLADFACIDTFNRDKIDKIASSETEYWFQCGNLFLVVVPKFVEAEPNGIEGAVHLDEHSALVDKLAAAIKSWDPPWMGCAIAQSRRPISDGAFRDDVVLPSDALQSALLHYIKRSTDDAMKRSRALEVAEHLLERRFAGGTRVLADALLAHLSEQADLQTDPDETKKLVELNAFLASLTTIPSHITLGTILKVGDEYWVCASPACDMEPRVPSQTLAPWHFGLAPFKPFQAVRLDVLTDESKVNKAAKEAEVGRNIFFYEVTEPGAHPSSRVGKSFEDNGDPRPKLELMFAAELGAFRDHKVGCWRCTVQPIAPPNDGQGPTRARPAFHECQAEVVGQLRAPYAERFLQYVGAHLSRIGVDYVGKARPPG